MEAVRISIPF